MHELKMFGVTKFLEENQLEADHFHRSFSPPSSSFLSQAILELPAADGYGLFNHRDGHELLVTLRRHWLARFDPTDGSYTLLKGGN